MLSQQELMKINAFLMKNHAKNCFFNINPKKNTKITKTSLPRPPKLPDCIFQLPWSTTQELHSAPQTVKPFQKTFRRLREGPMTSLEAL